MSCSDSIYPAGLNITFRGRVRSRLLARGTGQVHPRPGLQRSLFPPASTPSNRRISTSAATAKKRAFDAEPSPSPIVNVLRSVPTAKSGHRSQTEAAQAVLNRSDAHTQRISYLILERGQIVTSLNNVTRRLNEVVEGLHVVKVWKSRLLAIINLQFANTEKLIAGKVSYEDMISEQVRAYEAERKSFERADIYDDPNLQYVVVRSYVLRTLSACYLREPAEMGLFDAVERRRWSCRGKSIPRNCVAVSVGSSMFSFFGDATERSGRFCQP